MPKIAQRKKGSSFEIVTEIILIVLVIFLVSPNNVFVIAMENFFISIFSFSLLKKKFPKKYIILVSFFIFTILNLQSYQLLDWLNFSLAIALITSIGILIN